MDVPRLQLRWVPVKNDPYTRICFYELVLPCSPFDIRAKKGRDWIKVRLGRTRQNGSDTRTMSDGMKLMEPFRDGVHALRDSEALNIPAYVVWEGPEETLVKEHRRP